MTSRTSTDLFIVGAGYIAHHITREALAQGLCVKMSSRNRPARASDEHWIGLDARNERALSAAMSELRPKSVVLAHGPSDITWCEDNPHECFDAHTRITANIIKYADMTTHLVLISSDNVFPGTTPSSGESDPPNPKNAYGRAKLAAEEQLASSATQDVTILRTSMVYGLNEVNRGWTNFFALVQKSVASSQPLPVPTDRWNTPIWVQDVARIVLRVIQRKCIGLFHLAGATAVSRYDWAVQIAEAMGRDPSLIRGVDAASTRYACRPRYSCLHHEATTNLFAELILDRVSPLSPSIVLQSDQESRSMNDE